ncbi:MAG: uncharacterized membrane protein (UPF0127 family) [Rickettsiales bacterium]|jgi:uncharacterized membrane protein (UPF0127 family)
MLWKIKKNKFTNIVICLIAITFLTAFNSSSYNSSIQIKSLKTNITHNFKINIASEEESKQKGLMFIKNLPEDHGMLFEFKKERMVFMWMKNTKISLDMIFINKAGEIVSIKKRARPESLDTISSDHVVQKVLEINGGLTDKLGIEVGDMILIENVLQKKDSSRAVN